MALTDTINTTVGVLPSELATRLTWIIQAIGGLLVVYLIFLGIRLYLARKQNKMIESMKNDITLIKEKLEVEEVERERRSERILRRMNKVDEHFNDVTGVEKALGKRFKKKKENKKNKK